MTYGYVSVSTTQQHIDRQIDALFKMGLEKNLYILIMNPTKILIEKTIKN